MLKPCFYYIYKKLAGCGGRHLKIQKISRVWWRVPVIPVTLEAEAELLEPRRQRLQ